MKFNPLLYALVLLSNLGCHKEEITVDVQGKKLGSFADTVRADRYYTSDIISPFYTDFYNTWRLYKAVGINGNFDPGFQFLTFKKNGIYCFTTGETTLEYGQIVLLGEGGSGLKLWLKSDAASPNVFTPYEINLSMQYRDTLMVATYVNNASSTYWFEKKRW